MEKLEALSPTTLLEVAAGERVGLRLEGNKDPLSFDNPEETLS